MLVIILFVSYDYFMSKNSFSFNYKYGFTLAEVLITIVIIGVVAAMTIPNLVNKTNKEELRTGLLKAQTTVANALYLFYSKTAIS